MSLQYICAGLSRTGTTSFHRAMEVLGYKSMHFDTERLWNAVCVDREQADFKVYDDLDVISDLPAPQFLEELMGAYPDAKVILTVRNTEEWWRSISKRFYANPIKEVSPIGKLAMKFGWKSWPRQRYDKTRMFKKAIRTMAFGSSVPDKDAYVERYERHNEWVCEIVPPEKLLVIDVTRGDGWEKLCPFLGKKVPGAEFPWSKSH